jgi:hypothetical protein
MKTKSEPGQNQINRGLFIVSHSTQFSLGRYSPYLQNRRKAGSKENIPMKFKKSLELSA